MGAYSLLVGALALLHQFIAWLVSFVSMRVSFDGAGKWVLITGCDTVRGLRNFPRIC